MTGPVVLAIGAGLAVCVGIGLIFLLRPPNPGVGQSPGRPTPGVGASTAPASSTPAPLSPEETLRQQVQDDQVTVEGLVGSWVPQISSKKVGTVDAGTSFGYPEILDDFRSSKATFPEAVLLRSEDFTSFSSTGYWVTVVPRPFGTAEQANAWCGEQGIAVGKCFAKRLSHTDPPAGNTVFR